MGVGRNSALAISRGPCAMRRVHAPHLRACFVSALVASIVGGVRLDTAASGTASVESGGAAGAHAGKPRNAEVAGSSRADRNRELAELIEYVHSVNVQEPMTLSNCRDILYHFGRFREKVLGIGSHRDTRTRDAVRAVLREIRIKTDALDQLAAQKVSDGEVDDGGSVPPSQRDNICSAADQFELEAEFRMHVKALCEALDTVREVVLAGKDEEAAVFNVNGRLHTLKAMRDYALSHISWSIATVLGEEWRWVTRQLAQKPPTTATTTQSTTAADGSPSTSAPGDREAPSKGIDAWLTDAMGPSLLDPKIADKRITDALRIIDKVKLEEQSTLSTVRTSIQRLDLCKEMVVEFITNSDPEVRERIREVLRLIKDKNDALTAMAREKVAAGEVDDVEDSLPSERDNICRNLGDYVLSTGWRTDVRIVCDAMDKLRKTAWAGEDVDGAVAEVLGRLNLLKSRPGYMDMRIAGDLEIVFTEEFRWLHDQKKLTQPLSEALPAALRGIGK
mmetsp:Transcript_114522/g.329059  ORF Transcript_114522/g.329059 Transcript_114522/m.329059 type:complete len:506 (+) Transcript_114522:31-1548(+)|eukprot:CAMPEP_0170212672 /NCGR_PEP_ID=MMETSP0116_2-20130129/5954_1 /TAXON_ID=400756 /ORGANISM="Durinskia baltica, Strain CSIRO CS-38" /LENGTH=505 /DNA_ID=CAMNT_0010463211 /DNA_START=31 /DNA_END=1548 /DNA_ORIENTATION=+